MQSGNALRYNKNGLLSLIMLSSNRNKHIILKGKKKMIECPGCGSNLIYDIARRRMSCKACGMNYDVEEVSKQNDGDVSENMDINVFTCPQCAGEIYSTDDAATAFCSYCGASNMLTSRLRNERKPDYVIPFLVTKERCKDAYIELMKKAIYAPKKLKSRDHIQEFRGIYMPYWVCDAETKGPVEITSIERKSSGSYIEEITYEVTADVESRTNDIPIDASSMFSDNISDKIGPFNLMNLRPFSEGYLSGFYADLPDVDYNVYRKDATYGFNKQVLMQMYGVVSSATGTSLDPKAPLDSIFKPKLVNARTALLPVWFMSYKNGDRIAYASVNGQNGKVVADIPMDIKKFLLGCVIGTVPIYLLLSLIASVHPTALIFLVAMIAVVVSFIHFSEMKKIGIRDKETDDLGRAARHSYQKRIEREKLEKEMEGVQPGRFAQRFAPREPEYDVERKQPTGSPIVFAIALIFAVNVFSSLFFVLYNLDIISNESIAALAMVFVPIAAVVCCVNEIREFTKIRHMNNKAGLGGIVLTLASIVATAIELMKPQDLNMYYLVCVLMGIGIAIVLIDVANAYNRLVTKPLPQFEVYRGGDDRA